VTLWYTQERRDGSWRPPADGGPAATRSTTPSSIGPWWSVNRSRS